MLKLIGAVLVALLLAGCAAGNWDELAAEVADLEATIAAMQAATPAVVPTAPPTRPASTTPTPTKPPTATPRPTATPTPSTGDICYRTPEVQKVLLYELDLNACQVVTPGELFRVQELSIGGGGTRVIRAAAFKPGDFADLPNLKRLHLHVGEVPEPGVFDGLTGLERLSLQFGDHDSETERLTLPESMFASLPQLQVLQIGTSQNRHLRFQSNTLDSLPNLTALSVYATGYPPNALDNLSSLRCLRWVVQNNNENQEPDRSQQMPRDWLIKLPDLMTGTTGNSDDYCYQTTGSYGLDVALPPIIDLASLQAVIRFWGHSRGWDGAIFVDGERVSWLEGGDSGPHLLVGNRAIPVSSILGEWQE